ncbi:MAG: oligosaccharide flippase family protein, partial [Endomicrobium sp.]|nr:oligosaccharide flippase family protein [Endomicrobium sp.]
MEIKQSSIVYKGKKKLFKNWYYLTVLQIAQFVIPFIPIPYLVRVLSPEKFGLTAFAIAFAQLFAIFADYGFSYSAVKGIAVFKKDADKVCEIFSCAIIIKAVMAAAVTCVFGACLFLIPQLSHEKTVFVFAFLMVYADIFFTLWFFQGYEKMKYFAWLTVILQTLYVLGIFIFVKSESDYIYVPLLDALCYFIIGAASLAIIRKKFGVCFKLQPLNKIKFHFKRSWHYFISDFASNAYSCVGVFVLGFIANNAAVGYYRAALSVLFPLKAIFEPVVQAAYPYMSRLAVNSKTQALHFLKTYSALVAGAAFCASCLLFLSSEYIVALFLGADYAPSAVI